MLEPQQVTINHRMTITFVKTDVYTVLDLAHPEEMEHAELVVPVENGGVVGPGEYRVEFVDTSAGLRARLTPVVR